MMGVKNLRIKAKGGGVNGRIIINAPSHHRVVSVLAFTDKEASRLLDAVDNYEKVRLKK
mgnify:FL=1|jgi:hypothetical protein